MKLRALHAIPFLCFHACTLTMDAQLVFAPPPSPPLIPPALRRPISPDSQTDAPGSTAGNSTSFASSFLQWGRTKMHPYFSYNLTYSDGLQAKPGEPTSTTIQSLTLGTQVDLSDHWTASYVAAYSLYSNHRFQDSLSQSLNLAGGTTYRDWLLGFSQSYAASSAPRIETARQTSQQSVTTGLNASRRLGDKLSLDFSVAQSLQFVSSAPDTYDWSTSDFAHYRFSRHFETGLGIILGYTDTDPGSHMTYMSPQASVQWTPTDKLSLSIQGGRETRKFHQGRLPDLKSPTLGATLNYQPFKQTTLSFGASRNVSASILASQVTRAQTWSINLSQRLLQHFNLTVGITGQKSSYMATAATAPSFIAQDIADSDGNVFVIFVPVAPAARQDQSHSFSARLSTVLFGRVAVGASYQETRNSSNASGFGIDSRQVGLDIGYQF